MENPALVLHLDPQRLADHAKALVERTRDSAQALAALTTLQVFLDSFADGDSKAGAAYRQAIDSLTEHCEAARARVMADNLRILSDALRNRDGCAIEQAHRALSRNGFHQTALQAIAALSVLERAAAAEWVVAWLADAKARAEAASGYPDAFDFKKTGIAVESYTAMNELKMYLLNAG